MAKEEFCRAVDTVYAFIVDLVERRGASPETAREVLQPLLELALYEKCLTPEEFGDKAYRVYELTLPRRR